MAFTCTVWHDFNDIILFHTIIIVDASIAAPEGVVGGGVAFAVFVILLVAVVIVVVAVVCVKKRRKGAIASRKYTYIVCTYSINEELHSPDFRSTAVVFHIIFFYDCDLTSFISPHRIHISSLQQSIVIVLCLHCTFFDYCLHLDFLFEERVKAGLNTAFTVS